MGKIVIYNVPAYGHVNPSLPLVRELVQRGEEVVYFNHEAFREPIAASGATFRPVDNLIGHDFTRRNKTFVHLVDALLRQSVAYLPTGLKELEELGDVDLIIHDVICPWGRFLAQLTGTPRICLSSTLAMHKEMLFKSASPANFRVLLTQGAPAFFGYLRSARKLRQQYQLAPLNPFSLVTNHADCNIVFTSREFQPYDELFDDRYHFVGPSLSINENNPADAEEYTRQELPSEPCVFISLGTVFTELMPFYHACMEAFGNADYPVVMVVGRNTRMEDLGTPPSNFYIRPFVPQLEVLKRSRLFLTHGGTNSVSEALYFGVPMLILPPTSEHAFVGNAAETNGCARVISMKDVKPQRLRKLAEGLLSDPAYQEATQRIAASYRAAGGPPAAADIIQQRLQREIAGSHAAAGSAPHS